MSIPHRLLLSLVVFASCALQPSDDVSVPPTTTSQALENDAPPLPPETWSWSTSPAVMGEGPVAGALPLTSAVTPTGAYTMELPLDVPPGRAGMAPELALTYSSANTSNGPLGIGWKLRGTSTIVRCGASLATDGYVDGIDLEPFTDSTPDHFCLDGRRLVLVSGLEGQSGSSYRTEEDPFARITVTGADLLGPTQFEVRLENGRIRTYGGHEVPRFHVGPSEGLVDDGPARTAWVLEREQDRSNNEIRYEYEEKHLVAANEPTGRQLVLKTIRYTLHPEQPTAWRRIEFTWEARPDLQVTWHSGVRAVLHQRLAAVTAYAPNPIQTQAVWTYRLGYGTSSNAQRSVLTSVQRCGMQNGAAVACAWKKLFDWTSAPTAPAFTVNDLGAYPLAWDPANVRHLDFKVLDVNGDGASDLILSQRNPYGGQPGDEDGTITSARIRMGARVWPLLAEFDLFASGSAYRATTRLGESRVLDFDGDGRADLWSVYGSDIRGPADDFCREQVLRWNDATQRFVDGSGGFPDYVCRDAKRAFLDWDGDGRLDLVRATQVLDMSDPDGDLLPGPWKLYRNQGGSLSATATSTAVKSGCVARFTDLDGDGRGELVTARPIPNGDPCGISMVLSSVDQTLTMQTSSLEPDDFLGFDFYADPRSEFGDFNGDGLEDALRFTWPGGQAQLRFNTGRGFREAVTVMGLPSLGCNPNAPSTCNLDNGGVQVVDLNRDGRDDLVFLHYVADGLAIPVNGFAGHHLDLLAAISRGDGTFQQVNLTLPYATYVYGYNAVRFGDFNGDGALDLAFIEEEWATASDKDVEYRLKVALQQPAVAERVRAVRDEPTPWARESIEYSTRLSNKEEAFSACAWPLRCNGRAPMLVTRSVTSRAHLVDPSSPSTEGVTRHYSYEDPVSEAEGGRFLGFRKVRVWEPARPAETITVFDPRSFVPVVNRPSTRRFPSAAHPVSVTTVTPLVTAGATMRMGPVAARVTQVASVNSVKQLHQGLTFTVETREQVERTWEQQVTFQDGSNVAERLTGVVVPANAPITVNVSRLWDSYGNLTSHRRATVGGVTRELVLGWDNRVNDWLVRLPWHRFETQTEASGVSVSRRTTLTYDAQGRLEQEELESGADVSARVVSRLSRDGFGNVIKIERTGAGVLTPSKTLVQRIEYAPTFIFQPDEHAFVSQIWSPFTPAAYRPSTWLATHPAWGLAFATMDANGTQRFLRFDVLGRPVSRETEGEGIETWTWAGRADLAAPGGFNGLLLTHQGGTRVERTEFDARGLVLRQGVGAPNATERFVMRRYDAFGRLVSDGRPAFAGQPVSFTTHQFDALGRKTRTTEPNQAVSTGTWSLFESHAFDASGDERVTVLDADGRIIRTTELVASGALDTHYTWAPFGQLASVKVPAGGTWTFQYDVRGRLVHRAAPDQGSMRYQWTGLDELELDEHLESKRVRTLAYDALGRRTSTVDADGVTTFEYDTQPFGIGRLARTTSPDGVVTQHAWDAAGRPAGFVEIVDGESFPVGFGFDTLGRHQTTAFPSADGVPFTLVNGWAAGDTLQTLAVERGQIKTTMLTVLGRDAEAQLADALFGVKLSLKHERDPLTGRMRRVRALDGNQASLVDVTYGYRPDGLVSSRSDAVNGRSERFGHDAAHRLSFWMLAKGATNLMRDYEYDAMGNVRKVYDNGALVESNTYGLPGGAQPNTLATQTVGGQLTSFTYDVDGRQLTGAGRTFTWNEFDLPKNLVTPAGKWKWAYDAFGRRVKQVSPSGTTVFVPGFYERRTEAGQVTHVYFVTGPDGQIGQVAVDGKGARFQYTVLDAIGSVGTVLDPNGVVLDRLFHEPFGRRITAAGVPTSNTFADQRRGFTGHEDLGLDLVHMGGRLYDARARRFLSADPVISAPNRGQAWNPYSYVGNTVLNVTDPTGFRWSGEWSCLNVPGGCLEGSGSSGGGGTGGGGSSGGGSTETSEGSQHAMDSFMSGSESHMDEGGLDGSGGSDGAGGRTGSKTPSPVIPQPTETASEKAASTDDEPVSTHISTDVLPLDDPHRYPDLFDPRTDRSLVRAYLETISLYQRLYVRAAISEVCLGKEIEIEHGVPDVEQMNPVRVEMLPMCLERIDGFGAEYFVTSTLPKLGRLLSTYIDHSDRFFNHAYRKSHPFDSTTFLTDLLSH
jgi:RHS repeat-associated protein